MAELVKLGDKYSNISGLLKNPPNTWSIEEINGYVWWSFSICRNFYNLNSLIDKAFEKLFKDYGYVNISEDIFQEKLEQYYKIIDKSD